MIAQCALAQGNQPPGDDSLFSKYALPLVHQFTPDKPYYVVESQMGVSRRIRVVRQLNQKIAIIEVNSPEDLESLRHEARVAEALDSWKFSPSTERRLLLRGSQQQFIISSSNIDRAVEFS
jgi:hypothetical protein